MLKLLKFIFNISYKSVSLLINICLLILLPFVVLIVSLTTTNDANSLSLVWISVCTLLNVTLLIDLVIKIIARTKYNAVDSILYSKEFSKLQILGMKLLCIVGCIFVVNVSVALLMLITLGFAENINVGVSYFGSVIVIAIMLCIIILPIVVLFSLKYNEILSTSLNFIVLIILFISCLLPLVFNDNNNNKVSYEPNKQQINYTKFNYIDDRNSNNLLCITEQDKGEANTNFDYANNINGINTYINFLPSQWLLAPISNIFVGNNTVVNLDTIAVNNLSIIRAEQSFTYAPSKYIDEANPINNVFINAGDNDIFQNSYTSLLTSLKQKLTTIYQETEANTIINLFNKLEAIEMNTKLDLLKEETTLLKNLFGNELVYNDLFYFGLYINSFANAYLDLLSYLQTTTNQAYAQLIHHIWSVNNLREYLYFNNQIADFNFIKERFFIPFKINDDIAPAASNIIQIKEELIVVNEDLSSIKLQTKNKTYVDIAKIDFNAVFNDINNKTEWNNYVDTKTNTLMEFKLLYKSMSRLNSEIDELIFLPNEIVTSNIKFFQELKYVAYLNNSAVITVLIILCGLLLWGFAIRTHQKTNFAI